MLGKGIVLVLSLVSASAFANWSVDNDTSRVNFTSVKKGSVAEAHYFKSISGTLSNQGKFTLVADLNSVETLIPIRNERMKKYLFETATYPKLTVTADLAKSLQGLKVNQPQIITVPAKVSLHGVDKSENITVLVHKDSANTITVSSVMPVIVTAADFNLVAGVQQLQKIAKLSSIATAIPVNFSLTLKAN